MKVVYFKNSFVTDSCPHVLFMDSTWHLRLQKGSFRISIFGCPETSILKFGIWYSVPNFPPIWVIGPKPKRGWFEPSPPIISHNCAGHLHWKPTEFRAFFFNSMPTIMKCKAEQNNGSQCKPPVFQFPKTRAIEKSYFSLVAKVCWT